MDIVDVEIILLGIILILSYFLPAILWLFHLAKRAKLLKAANEQEYRKIVWFARDNESITLHQIKIELMNKDEKAKRRLRILFSIVLPSICFLVSIILIKHIGRYYVKRKFDFDLPETNIQNYIGTLVLLSAWTAGVLLNKLHVYRVSEFLKKAEELSGNAHSE